MPTDAQGLKPNLITVEEFEKEISHLESAFRDKLPDDTMLVYYSALNDRTQKDLAAAVKEIMVTATGNRVPNIATIKMHLSHVHNGGYFE